MVAFDPAVVETDSKPTRPTDAQAGHFPANGQYVRMTLHDLSQRRPVAAVASAITLALLLLAACAPAPPDPPLSAAPVAAASHAQPAPADAFLAAIARHCGQAFAGRVVIDQPAQDNGPFAGKPLRMHVRGCREGRIDIPFQVGDDRSRTWQLRRTADGLQLKHDHRHQDGSEDALTQYGGATVEPGTAGRQAFPVDAESIDLFERLGYPASVSNTWAMEIIPDRQFVYALSRPDGRLFRVEFDLSEPVPPPPPPWGHE